MPRSGSNVQGMARAVPRGRKQQYHYDNESGRTVVSPVHLTERERLYNERRFKETYAPGLFYQLAYRFFAINNGSITA